MEESSIPKKAFKIGPISKKLIGKAIRVGYNDGPYEDGIIIGIGDRRITDIEFVVMTGERQGQHWSVDSKEQVIAIGSVELKFTY